MPTLTQNEAVTIVQQFRNIENDPHELIGRCSLY
ncbi:MAG: hypothetical protein KatS3mg035_0617 [Bacteroidia bacterium]|nr:MAG: hypothetical protein KatS3mg035_0617 [Bacteroidia bacterium]